MFVKMLENKRLGAPGMVSVESGIQIQNRTCDRPVNSRVLYLAELRRHFFSNDNPKSV